MQYFFDKLKNFVRIDLFPNHFNNSIFYSDKETDSREQQDRFIRPEQQLSRKTLPFFVLRLSFCCFTITLDPNCFLRTNETTLLNISVYSCLY